jgi:hypothetical protein
VASANLDPSARQGEMKWGYQRRRAKLEREAAAKKGDS